MSIAEAPEAGTASTAGAGTDRQPARTPTDGSVGVFLVLAELGLLAMALGTAAGFSRLFTGWSFLGTLAVPLVACWGSRRHPADACGYRSAGPPWRRWCSRRSC